MPSSIIQHKGVDISVNDSRGLKSEELMENLDTTYREAEDFVKANGHKIKSFTDLRDTSVSNDFMEKAKGYGNKNGELFDKMAIIGITGMKSILLKAYNSFLSADKTKLTPFNSKEEAMDWLAKD